MAVLTTRTTGAIVSVSLATGGSGYTSPPSVSVIGGGGTGAAAVAHMAGTQVESVVLTASGTGYTSSPTVSFSGGGGTGAAATAYAHTGPLRPMSFFRGRFNDLYGVDGMGRGLRWDGTNAIEPIGISKPALGPSVQAVSGGGKYVKDVQVVSTGVGYSDPPTVTFTGGTPTTAAAAKASISNGRVSAIVITEPGSGYQEAPSVAISGGIAGGAQLSVGVLGSVESLAITAQGTGYTGAPTVVFSSAQGLTSALAVCVVEDGKLSNVRLLSGGTGLTTTGVTASVVGGGGTAGRISVRPVYRVDSVTAVSGGTGYRTPPVLTFLPAAEDADGGGATAEATVTAGSISSVQVKNGGTYYAPPTAIIRDSNARATATMSSTADGTYKCCIRYLDDTPESLNGPVPSSISELVEVDVSGAGGMTWTFTHSGLEDRVSAMELWRTTAGQSVVLFRVATIQRTDPAFFGAYSDTLTDDDLKDTERAGYGLMPVTLPSGQLNARRFGVPPGHYAVACMFQDRAWYAVDTTGEKPNSLLYSEVDEPESVPDANELIVQENVSDPDEVVALVPLGSALLVCQRRHLYKLQYVSQPVIDASIALVGYRGILNSRCWCVLGGVAYIADSYGLYAFDGNSEQPVSVPVDNYWRDGLIYFPASQSFHVAADQASKVVRFFYCLQGESLPRRALCYCVATKAWWEEQYSEDITASSVSEIGGRQDVMFGTGSGSFMSQAGQVDAGGNAIPYQFRTGNFPLEPGSKDGTSRSIALLYEPTDSASQLGLRLHYNNSPSPRPFAIADSRGGFVTVAGSTQATLDMQAARSPLGEANGVARAYFSGRVDDRNVGGDRHVAVAVAGTQASTSEADAVKVYAIAVEGVG